MIWILIRYHLDVEFRETLYISRHQDFVQPTAKTYSYLFITARFLNNHSNTEDQNHHEYHDSSKSEYFYDHQQISHPSRRLLLWTLYPITIWLYQNIRSIPISILFIPHMFVNTKYRDSFRNKTTQNYNNPFFFGHSHSKRFSKSFLT